MVAGFLHTTWLYSHAEKRLRSMPHPPLSIVLAFDSHQNVQPAA